MALDPRTPVIIGVGQIVQRAHGLDDARDPVALMGDAIRAASSDASLSSVPNPDAIRVVSLLSWRYGNPAHFIAEDLGLAPQQLGLSANGGNTPQTLVNNAALDIIAGKCDLVFLTGGETSRTRARARKAGVDLNWRSTDIAPEIVSEEMQLAHPDEIARKLYMPIQVYPMFETAIRAHAGRSVEEQMKHSSELWSRFSRVAAKNPFAWSQREYTADEIRTVSASNRMVGFPYPKLMNSNNDVDMSAAVIMCSAQKAEALGVPRDRWVFPHSGTDVHEHLFISHRMHFHDTPAIRLGGRRALELAGINIDDVSVVDLYSCFPSAVQLGAASLGLDITSQLTRTGGLPFAGGPWNNYVMHAIATVVNDLRERPSERGLVWANGGYATKHAFGVYSATPPTTPYRHAYPQAEIDALPKRDLASAADAAGKATIEAFVVMHNRDGSPELIYSSCLLADGRRAWGMSSDAQLGTHLCDGEWVGSPCTLSDDGTLFVD